MVRPSSRSSNFRAPTVEIGAPPADTLRPYCKSVLVAVADPIFDGHHGRTAKVFSKFEKVASNA